jgi:hypothetical protein
LHFYPFIDIRIGIFRTKEAIVDIRYEIEKKAYELFEKNGRICGCELENWLEAEKIVCAKTLPSKAAGKPALKKAAATKPAAKKTAAKTTEKESRTAATAKTGTRKTTSPKPKKASTGKQATL